MGMKQLKPSTDRPCVRLKSTKPIRDKNFEVILFINIFDWKSHMLIATSSLYCRKLLIQEKEKKKNRLKKNLKLFVYEMLMQQINIQICKPHTAVQSISPQPELKCVPWVTVRCNGINTVSQRPNKTKNNSPKRKHNQYSQNACDEYQ